MHSGIVDGKRLDLCDCGAEGRPGEGYFRCGPIRKGAGDPKRPRSRKCNHCGSPGELKNINEEVWWLECTGCGAIPAKVYDPDNPEILWPAR